MVKDENNGFVRWRQLIAHSLTMAALVIGVMGGILGFLMSEINQVEKKANDVPVVKQQLQSIKKDIGEIKDRINDGGCAEPATFNTKIKDGNI